jgi:5-hydroxyisourate hydrolase
MSLSTHVLDTMHGSPAAGVKIILTVADKVVFEGVTDTDGRCPALRALEVGAGTYRFSFAAGDYFRGRGVALTEPAFLDVINIDFGMVEGGGHYHVPLLVSPYAYSTYRGS